MSRVKRFDRLSFLKGKSRAVVGRVKPSQAMKPKKKGLLERVLEYELEQELKQEEKSR
jgi:hypothetical protein